MVMSMHIVISMHTQVLLEDLESDNILYRVVFRSIIAEMMHTHCRLLLRVLTHMICQD